MFDYLPIREKGTKQGQEGFYGRNGFPISNFGNDRRVKGENNG